MTEYNKLVLVDTLRDIRNAGKLISASGQKIVGRNLQNRADDIEEIMREENLLPENYARES